MSKFFEVPDSQTLLSKWNIGSLENLTPELKISSRAPVARSPLVNFKLLTFNLSVWLWAILHECYTPSTWHWVKFDVRKDQSQVCQMIWLYLVIISAKYLTSFLSRLKVLIAWYDLFHFPSCLRFQTFLGSQKGHNHPQVYLSPISRNPPSSHTIKSNSFFMNIHLHSSS